MFVRCFMKAGLALIAMTFALPASAELKTTNESGVSVTRGVVPPKQPFVDDSPSAVFTLPNHYHGAVFGKRRFLVNGRLIKLDYGDVPKRRCGC